MVYPMNVLYMSLPVLLLSADVAACGVEGQNSMPLVISPLQTVDHFLMENQLL